jgi:hypothetical protein
LRSTYYVAARNGTSLPIVRAEEIAGHCGARAETELR